MKKFALAAVAVLIAAPVLAEPSCTLGEALKPVWESLKAFEEAGGTVVSFKVNDGQCYEIYGTVQGVNYEVFYDPNTGAELDRIAA